MIHFAHMTSGDLNTRYRGSIIRLNNRAFNVSEVTGNKTLVGTYVSTGRPANAGIDNPALNSHPFPLGYLPESFEHIFTWRTPHRVYKQGLNSRNLVGIGSRGAIGGDRLLNDGLFQRQIDRIINDDYPCFDEALEFVRNVDNAPRQAFSRDFCIEALDEDLLLYYRGSKVGEIINGEPELDENYSFLEGVLGKRLNKEDT